MLLKRSELHDQSKLESPEVELLSIYTDKLHGLTYGTPDYQESLDKLEPALVHHYANNRHHPQHFKDGINDMNLIDLVEMFCDWKASSERQNGGNLRMSIRDNAERYKICPQLEQIFENSIDLFNED